MMGFLLSVVCLNVYAGEGEYITRYGKFQIKESENYPTGALYFNHQIVKPVIEGNNNLTVNKVFKLQNDDVLLVEEIGGSGCPITLYFVKVTPSKEIFVSSPFGSCSDLIKVSATASQIMVTMPDFIGAPESEEQAGNVARHKMTYIYDGNVVKENGKIVKRES